MSISIPKKIKIFEKHNGHCYYCNYMLKMEGKRADNPKAFPMVVDHFKPKSKGGSDTIENLVPSCEFCNTAKKDTLLKTNEQLRKFRNEMMTAKKIYIKDLEKVAETPEKPTIPLENNNEGKSQVAQVTTKPPKTDKAYTLFKPEKGLILPQLANTDKNVINYLAGKGISEQTARKLTNLGLVYESLNKTCVFLGNDGMNTKYALEYGIDKNFEKEVKGSKKHFSFKLPPKNKGCTLLAVFENPLDTIAHFEICAINAKNKDPVIPWDGYRLAGDSLVAVNGFLERNPHITHVQLCLNNDKAGQKAVLKLVKNLLRRKEGIIITISPPPIGKSYAYTLKAVVEQEKMKAIGIYG